MERKFSKNSRRLAIGLGIGLVLHFFLLLVHTLPFDVFPQKVKTASNLYVNPFFLQNWALFAPAPRTDYTFEINIIQANGDSTGYFDPIEEIRQEHLAFPFNPSRQRLVVATNKTGVWVHTDLWNGMDSAERAQYPNNFNRFYGAKPLLEYVRAFADKESGEGKWLEVEVRMHTYEVGDRQCVEHFQVLPDDK